MKGKGRQNPDRRAEAISHEAEHEPVIECVTDLPPLIDPGDHDAICYDVQYGRGFGGRKTVYVWFRLIDGDFIDAELYMACTYYGSLTPRSKLHKQWTLAFGHSPRKGDRFSKRVFLNKAFRVRVRTVATDEHGQARPTPLQYSIIDKIVEPIAGVPFQCK